MLDFIELGDLVQNCLSRIDLRKTGETPSDELIDDIESELEGLSQYVIPKRILEEIQHILSSEIPEKVEMSTEAGN